MGIKRSLKQVYKKEFLALNAALAISFTALFYYMQSLQQFGPAIGAMPFYMVALLALSSSVVLTIGIYFIKAGSFSMKTQIGTTGIGAIIPVLGGIIGGCGCTAPILFGLVAIGVSSSDVVVLDNFISAYQFPIFAVMIGINLFVTMYYLNRISLQKPKRRG